MDDDDFFDLLGGDDILGASYESQLTKTAQEDMSAISELMLTPPLTSSPGEVDVRTASVQEIEQHDLSERNACHVTHSLFSNTDVIAQIESVFEKIAEDLLNEENQIHLALKIRRTTQSQSQRDDDDKARIKQLSFPGANAMEAWRFCETLPLERREMRQELTASAVVVRILELIHEALCDNVIISMRDIYYRDPALFGSQTHVNRYTDDIAFTFGTTRSALNVTAAAKGLIAGAITFVLRDGSTIDARSEQQGILVPALNNVLSVDMNAVKWILVVEKEATFRSIATSPSWDEISANGTILTAKGYPDIATRALLSFLVTPSPRNGFAFPPVFGLADYDPDGIAILSTYKYGSIALAHEAINLCVPQLQWIGLQSEHITLGIGNTHGEQGLLALTERDRNKAHSMLKDRLYPQKETDHHQTLELQIMLMLNKKAELQLLDAIPNGMAGVLATALGSLRS